MGSTSKRIYIHKNADKLHPLLHPKAARTPRRTKQSSTKWRLNRRKTKQSSTKWTNFTGNTEFGGAFPWGKAAPPPTPDPWQLQSLGTNTRGKSLRPKTAGGRKSSLQTFLQLPRGSFALLWVSPQAQGQQSHARSFPTLWSRLSWDSSSSGFCQYLQPGGIFVTRAGGAWSLNIILDPCLHSCPTSISESLKKIQIIRGSEGSKSLLYHPLVLGGLTQNPAVPKTSPEGWKGHFQTFQRDLQTHVLLFKSTKEPKPQQDFQRSPTPNVAPTGVVPSMSPNSEWLKQGLQSREFWKGLVLCSSSYKLKISSWPGTGVTETHPN